MSAAGVSLGPTLITTIAGTGVSTPYVEGSVATDTAVNSPAATAYDADGNLYIAALNAHVVYKVSKTTGLISRFAGTGNASAGGSGILATNCGLYRPRFLLFDQLANELYISDSSNHAIRKVKLSNGFIYTVAGMPGNIGGIGDGGLATMAKLSVPVGLAIFNGFLYFCDSANHKIRRIDLNTGVISLYAGTGISGPPVENVSALSTYFSNPEGIYIKNGADTFLYVCDTGNSVVRRIDITTGYIHRVAGTGQYGASISTGMAYSAQLAFPRAVVFDSMGHLIIADYSNNRLLKVVLGTGAISLYAGNGSASTNPEISVAISASKIYLPCRVSADPQGNVVVSEYGSNKVRKIH